MPIDVSLGLSERQDSLNWSIAGSNVNILSELEWSQLHIRQIQANATVHLPQHLNLAIDIQRGLGDILFPFATKPSNGDSFNNFCACSRLPHARKTQEPVPVNFPLPYCLNQDSASSTAG